MDWVGRGDGRSVQDDCRSVLFTGVAPAYVSTVYSFHPAVHSRHVDATSLSRLTQRLFGAEALRPKRLSGGASMESWRFSSGGGDYVLRRLPEGASGSAAIAGLPLATEAAVIRLARAHGVRAPEVLGELEEGDGLGTGYVMRAIDGETLPHRILGNPAFDADIILRDAARQLAAIHAVPMDGLDGILCGKSMAKRLSDLRDLYGTTGADIPTFDLAFDWLDTHMPEDVAPRLLHGDFRMGNLMIAPDGITGVLDWELTHLGDPAQDIGFLCAPSWRFGHWHMEVGGLGDLDTFLGHYRDAGGGDIPPERVRFWEVFSSLWWGLVCIQMVELWRSGEVRTLERPVIGTRVSETEIDLLLLLDRGDLPRFDFALPDPVDTSGDTNPCELLTALSEWAGELITATSGHARFEARIARNALGIVSRSLRYGPPPEPTDLASLRRNVMHRLCIDQPRYAGLAVAMERWIQ